MSTSSRELNINTIVLTAYQLAGVMNELQTASGPQWDARSSYGRRQLEMTVDALAAEGIFERSMDTYDVAVASGATRTELPADTVDVRGNAGLVQADGSVLELKQLRREEFNGLVIPTQTGMPIQVYVARTAPMYLYTWPVPDADYTVRLQRQRMTFDNSSGSATVDLERFWVDYLVHELAARIALTTGMPMERYNALNKRAEVAQMKARGKASDQLPNRFVLNHPGPYRS